MRLYQTLMASFVLASSFLPIGKEGSTPLEFNSKSWTHLFGHVPCKVTILGVDDYSNVSNTEQALEILKQDSFSVILVSDYSDAELKIVKETLSKAHDFNPDIIRGAELIHYKMKNGSGGVAKSNSFSTIEEFRKSLMDYTFGESYSSQDTGSYKEKVRGEKDYLVKIPVSEEDYQGIMRVIREDYVNDKPDGFDLVLVSLDVAQPYELLAHEWTHIAVHECEDEYSLYQKLRGGISPVLTVHTRAWVKLDYATERQKEVEEYVREKRQALEEWISHYESLDDQQREKKAEEAKKGEFNDNYNRFLTAMKTLGADRVRELYAKILDEVILDWQLADHIAEDGEKIITQNSPYHELK